MSRDDNVRPEILRAEQAARESSRRADADMVEARRAAAAAAAITARLRRLNASNGFAELLIWAVATRGEDR